MLFYSHLCATFDFSIVITGNSTPIDSLAISSHIWKFHRLEEEDNQNHHQRKDSRERGTITTSLIDWRWVPKRSQVLPLLLSDPLFFLPMNTNNTCNIKMQGNKVSNKGLVYCLTDTKICCSSVFRQFYHCQHKRYSQMTDDVSAESSPVYTTQSTINNWSKQN